MYCNVCGEEKSTKYRAAKRQHLCAHCNSDTPSKVTREAFNLVYWGGDKTVPEAIKREFYLDYLTSCCTLDQYIEQTTELA